MKLSMIITISTLVVFFTFIAGYKIGEGEAFLKITTEQCWLNEQSRDIECITYIAD